MSDTTVDAIDQRHQMMATGRYHHKSRTFRSDPHMIFYPFTKPIAWPMLHHIMLNRHPSRTRRQRECQDSQALTDPLTGRALVVTSW